VLYTCTTWLPQNVHVFVLMPYSVFQKQLHLFSGITLRTRSSAVPKRPCDASCLSVVSFNSIIPQAHSLVLDALASDLPMCTIKFYSVLLGVPIDAC